MIIILRIMASFPLKIFLFFLSVTAHFVASSQTAIQTSLGNNSPVTICNGSTLVFNASTSNQSQYDWIFPGGNPNSATGSGPHTVTFNAPGSYAITLETSLGETASFVVDVEPSALQPSIFNESFGESSFQGNTYLTYCTSTPGLPGALLSFETNSNGTNGSTIHTFNWGDGTPDLVIGGTNFQLPIALIEHFYSTNGYFELTYSISNGGCLASEVYSVFVGASPSATITTGGLTTLCAPSEVDFIVGMGSQNGPGTTYLIQVNDGSSAVLFDHPISSIYTHTFNNVSCNNSSVINGVNYPNAYQVSITAQNACGVSSNTIGPITVQSSTEALLTTDVDLAEYNNLVCEGSTVQFQDISLPGTTITGTGVNTSCTATYRRYWQIVGPNGLVTLPSSDVTVNGSLGNNNGQPLNPGVWSAVSAQDIDITFLTPGVYTVNMYTGGNNCGVDTASITLCVLANFEIEVFASDAQVCVPALVEISTNDIEFNCPNANFSLWDVIVQNPNNCGTSSWNYAAGSGPDSFSPTFEFTGPGIYSITLSSQLENPVFSNTSPLGCQATSDTIVITALDKPELILSAPEEICLTDEFTPVIEVNMCYDENPENALWNFGSAPPASIASATSLNPTVTYSDFGVFAYSVESTNVCGTSIIDSTILVFPNVVVFSGNDTLLCLNTALPIAGQVIIGNDLGSGSWSASVSGGFFDNSNQLSTTYTPPSDFVGSITLTLTSEDPAGPCGIQTHSFLVTYSPEPTLTLPDALFGCVDELISLTAIAGGATNTITWSDNGVGGSFSAENSSVGTANYLPPIGAETVWLFAQTDEPNPQCPAAIDSVLLTVFNLPVLNPLSPVFLCNGNELNLAFSGSGTDYVWEHLQAGIGLPLVGSGNIANTSLINSTSDPIIVELQVTPLLNVNGISCVGITESVEITIWPTSTVLLPDDQVLCNGEISGEVVIQSTVVGTTFTWTNDNTATGLIASGTDIIPSFTAQNPGDEELISLISITSEANGCPGESAVYQIVVNPTPTVDAVSPITVCSGQEVNVNFAGTGTTYTWTNSTPEIGLSNTGADDIQFAAVNNTLLPIDALIEVTPGFVFNGIACDGDAITFSITVNPNPELSATPSVQSVCNGETTTEISWSSNLPNTNFTWVNSTIETGIASTGSGNVSALQVQNLSNASIQSEFLVSGEALGCTTDSVLALVTVLPTPVITNAENLQVICSGAPSQEVIWFSSVTDSITTFEWDLIAADPGITGFVNSGSGSLPEMLLVNSSNVVQELIYAIIPVSSSCEGPTLSYRIQVLPTPIMQAVDEQIICSGSVFADILPVSSVANTQFSWELSGTVPPGISGQPNVGSGTLGGVPILNTGTDPAQLTYVFTPNASGCSGNPVSFLLTVNPSPIVTFSPGNQTICSGETTVPVILSSTTPGVSFSWNVTDQSPQLSGVLPTNGSGGIPSYTLVNGTSDELASVTFEAIATTSGAQACPGVSAVYTLFINPIPVMTDNVPSQVYCVGEAVPQIQFTGTATNYNWSNSNTSIGLASAGLGAIQSFVAANPNSLPITGLIEVTPEYETNGVGCAGAGISFSISVNPTPTVNPVANQTLCNGSASDEIVFLGTGTSYEWTNSTISIGLGASGSGTIAEFIGTNNTQAAITANLSVQANFTASGLTCLGNLQNFTFTVLPTPQVTDPQDQVVCNGEAVQGIVFGGSATAFAWTNSNSGIGLPASGTGNINAFTAVNNGNTPVNATITVVPQFTLNGVTCSGPPQDFTITVNPTPSANAVSNQEYCNGQSTNQIIFGGTASAYNWTNSNTTIGLGGSGTGPIPTFTAINTGLSPETGLITVTPVFNNQGVSCTGTAIQFNFIINPTPQVDAIANQVVCNGTSTSAVIFTGNATNYSWTNSDPSIGLPASGTGNIPSFTAINSGSTPVTATIQVQTGFSGGGADCDGLSSLFTITVNPTPNVTLVPTSQIVCNGGPTEPITPSGTGTGYTWTNSLTAIGLNSSGSGTINSFTAQNSNPSAQTAEVVYTPQYTNLGITCTGAPVSSFITVNPTPVVNPIQNSVVCNGGQTGNIIFSGTGTTYSWTNSNPSIGLASSGTGSIGSFEAINTSSVPVVATITVTPFFDGASDACPGNSIQFTLTVNPTPLVNAVANQTLCVGQTSSVIIFSGTGNAYTWTNTDPTIGVAGTGTGNINSFLATNNSGIPVTGGFIVTAQYTNEGLTCPGSSTTFAITVAPIPSVSALPDVFVCEGSSSQEIVPSGVATNFQWTNSTTLIGLPGSGFGNIPSFLPANPSNQNPLQAQITYQPIYELNGVQCLGATTNFDITVYPIVDVDLVADFEVCNQQVANAVTFTGTATNYIWSSSNTSIGLPASGTGNLPSFTAINSGASPVQTVITVTPQYTDNQGIVCNGNPRQFTIVVNPSPTVNPIDPLAICNSSSFSVLLGANMPSNFSWQAADNPSVTGESLFLQPSPNVSNTLTNTSSAVQSVQYTVFPISSPQGCSGNPYTFEVVVIPDVVVTGPTSYEVCSGGSVTVNLAANVPSNFEWFATDNPQVEGESTTTQVTPVINDLLTNESGVGQLVVYTIVPTSIQASCPGAVQTISVLVNPPLDLINDTELTICSGQAVNLILEANSSGVFNWFANPNPLVSGETTTVQNTSFINDVLVNTTNEPVLVTYNVVVTSASQGCTSPNFAINVWVNPTPNLVSSSNQIVCNSTNTAPVLFSSSSSNTAFNWTNSNTSIGLNAQGAGDIPSFQAVNNGTAVATATISAQAVVEFNQVACAGQTQTVIIEVVPTPSSFVFNNQFVCNGASTQPINLAGPVQGTQFNWTHTNPNLGLAFSGSGSIPGFTAQNNGNTPQVTTVSILPEITYNGTVCAGIPAEIDFTVYPTPTANPVNDQQICNGSSTSLVELSGSVSGATYNWTNNNPFVGLAASGVNTIPAFTAVNSANDVLSVPITITPVLSENGVTCAGPTTSFNYLIHPTPTVDPVASITVCAGEGVAVPFASTFMGNVPGLSFNWTNSNPTIGLQAAGTGNLGFTATNSSNAPISATIVVQPVYTINGVVCGGESQTFTVTVNPVPTVDAVSSQTVCANTPVAIEFTSALGVANTNYTWTNSNPSIGLAGSGSGSLSFTSQNTTSGPLIGLITVTPTYNSGGTQCVGQSMSFSLTVNPVPDVAPLASLTFCQGEGIVLPAFTSTVTGTLYNWSHTNPAIGLVASGSGQIPSFTASNGTNSPISSTFTVNSSYSNNGQVCVGNVQTFTVTVNPVPTVDAVSSQTICANTPVAIEFTSALGVANTNYTWTNSNPSIGLAGSGSGSLSFTSQNTTSGPLTGLITVTPTYNSGGTQCVGQSMSFSLTVNPVPDVAPLASLTFCQGEGIVLPAFTSTVTGTLYNWSHTNPAIGLVASGSGQIPSFTASNGTNSSISSVFTVNSSYSNNGQVCVGNAQTFTVTVNPVPTVDAVSSQTVCANTPVSIEFTSALGVANTNYTWTNSNPSIGLAGSGNGSLSFAAQNTTSGPLTGLITVTPTYNSGGTQCVGQSMSFSLTVNPVPDVAPLASLTFCQGEGIVLPAFTSTVTGTLYNWSHTNPAIGLVASGSGQIPSFTASNGTNSSISSVFTVNSSYSNNGQVCVGNAQTFTVTVNPVPTVDAVSSQTVCANTNFSAITFTGSVAGTQYQWQNNNPSIGLAGSGTNGISSFTGINQTGVLQTGALTVTPVYTSGGTQCIGSSINFELNVNPLPVVQQQPNLAFCNTISTPTIFFNSSVSGTSYSWVNSNPSIGLPASGQGAIPSFTAVNTGVVPVNATITVFSEVTINGVQCAGNPMIFTISVNPTPTVVAPLDQVVCHNEFVVLPGFSGQASDFAWTNNNPSIGLPASGTGNIPPFTVSNPSMSSITATLSVTPQFTDISGNTCSGETVFFTLTIHPAPIVNPGSQQICSGEEASLNLSANMPSTFSWFATNNPNVSGESLTPQNSAVINDLLVNEILFSQLVGYTVIATSDAHGCPSLPQSLSVIVHPLPAIDFTTANEILCSLNEVEFVNLTDPLTANFFWDFGDGSQSTAANPVHTYTDYGQYTVTLIAVNQQTGCTDTLIKTIELFQAPDVNFASSATQGCVPASFEFADLINTPGALVEWQFGDGTISNQPVLANHVYTTPGCYDVTLSVLSANGCPNALTLYDYICVYALPFADFSVSNNGVYSVAEPIAEFTNNSLNGYLYSWNFGDGNSSTMTNPVHVYTDGVGQYVVTLVVFNEAGCSDTTNQLVIIKEDVVVYVPNSFTPNNDGANDVFLPIITSGVVESQYQLLIFNRWGEVIFQTNDVFEGWDGTFNGTIVQDGVYIWQMEYLSKVSSEIVRQRGHVNLFR
jgi:gliding motility-associated-like protein